MVELVRSSREDLQVQLVHFDINCIKSMVQSNTDNAAQPLAQVGALRVVGKLVKPHPHTVQQLFTAEVDVERQRSQSTDEVEVRLPKTCPWNVMHLSQSKDRLEGCKGRRMDNGK